MTTEPPPRSQQACPVCGEHRVAVVDFPEIAVEGAQPFTDMIGMGDLPAPVPGLQCLACGATWPSIDAFRAASEGPGGPA